MRRGHMTLAQRREYRRMMRLLRELDREDAGRSRRSGGARGATSKLLAVALGVVLVAVFGLSVANKVWGVTLTTDGLQLAKPLGQPPDVRTGAGTFTFLLHQPHDAARPVAYDPCRPIEYEVNDAIAPPGAGALVNEAVAEIGRATGLQFRYAGPTDRLPDYGDQPIKASREPALIAWTTPQVVPDLEGSVAGVGGSTPRRHHLSGDLEYVTGAVALDSPDLRNVLARPDGREQVRAIVMHELGHLVGLGHVDAPDELMYDDNAGQIGLGPGDRKGLAVLGSGPCYH